MPRQRYFADAIPRIRGAVLRLGVLVSFGVFAPPSPAQLLASAQSAPASRTVCVQPPGNGSKIVPTLDLPLIKPISGAPSLKNPLVSDDTKTLVMLTLGDSAMWGNGLNIGHKYSHQVAQDVANATGRSVHLVSYAHSGANLSTENGSSYEPLKPADNGTPPGDLNAWFPTTLQQEACAASNDKTQDAEIVLLNGCINDVSALKISLPFPLSGATANEITRRSHQQCSDKMLTLIRNTQQDFLQATIIVSNYWRIVSDKSSPIGVAMAKNSSESTPADLLLQAQMNQLLQAELKAEKLTDQTVTTGDALIDRGSIFLKWGDNSAAFLKASQGCFTWAVATADGTTALPNNPAEDECPTVTFPPVQRVTNNLRVFLATVPDDPNFSYGAPHKHIWIVPINAVYRADERYKERLKLCRSHYVDLGNLFICRINPTAHPNLIGANSFRDSIDQILKTAWQAR